MFCVYAAFIKCLGGVTFKGTHDPTYCLGKKYNPLLDLEFHVVGPCAALSVVLAVVDIAGLYECAQSTGIWFLLYERPNDPVWWMVM